MKLLVLSSLALAGGRYLQYLKVQITSWQYLERRVILLPHDFLRFWTQFVPASLEFVSYPLAAFIDGHLVLNIGQIEQRRKLCNMGHCIADVSRMRGAEQAPQDRLLPAL